MKKNMQRLFGLMLVLVMLLSLVACGGGNESDNPNGGTSQEPGGSGSGESVGANVTIATFYDRTNLSPLRTTKDNVYPDILMIYERPMYLTPDNEYVPWLIKDYSTTDGVNYDFEIYDYITDSQNNRITAEDIVWIIEKNIEVAMKPDFSKVVSVEATGDYTVHIELNENRVYLFETIMWNTNVVSKAAFEASSDEMATSPVSTSPYVVTNFVPSSTLTLEKRDGYWQTDASLIPAGLEAVSQSVTFNTVAELAQRTIAVETGVADIAFDIDASAIDPFLDNKNYVTSVVPDMEGVSLFVSGHASRIVSDNLALRQAIFYAIDPNALVQGVAFGHGSPMSDYCPPVGVGYLNKWDNEEYFTHNVDKAKALLAEAGYNGEEISMVVFNNWQRIGEIIQSSCLEAGINIKLDIKDYAGLGQVRTDGSAWDMFLYCYTTPSLAYNWSLCFDSNAFPTGDAMSRKDEELTNMLYTTWVNGGYTEQNIDAIHSYIMDHAYARGLFLQDKFNIVRADANLSWGSTCYLGTIAPWSISTTK